MSKLAELVDEIKANPAIWDQLHHWHDFDNGRHCLAGLAELKSYGLPFDASKDDLAARVDGEPLFNMAGFMLVLKDGAVVSSTFRRAAEYLGLTDSEAYDLFDNMATIDRIEAHV